MLTVRPALVILAAVSLTSFTGADGPPKTSRAPTPAVASPSVDAEDLEHSIISLEEVEVEKVIARGVPLFEYDTDEPLNVEREGTPLDPSDEYSTIDISYSGWRGRRVTATVMIPAGNGPWPAIVFQHGMPSTRADTLATARRYAASGVVTIAIDAPFARRGAEGLARPVTFTARDRRDQIRLIVDLRRAVDYLIGRGDVDEEHIGYLGVSYGGAMGGLLAGVENRISAYVLVVGDGGLLEHFTGIDDGSAAQDLQAGWIAAMEPIEPIYYVGQAAPAEILFQNALRDEAVTVADAVRYQLAGSEPKDTIWYDSGHALPFEAKCDAAKWLQHRLEISGTEMLVGCE
jgi:dienelactone hydrolase